ncbi:MAG TPA: glutathione S-transferase family protein [Polyangiaceae bacterium]|jgi:glutathione S-transferase|nr:glutathione S-transferase family protein [Polyangiaceae bacterium]
MALKLYQHPLASFCHKPLMAFYENETPFEPILVDLGDATSRAEFVKVWPMAKFPVLHDTVRDEIVPESTIIIEYVSQHYPGKAKLVPDDPDLARNARQWDRFHDNYVQDPMQKIIGDRLRPAEHKDPFGVEQAKKSLEVAYGILETAMANKTWALGDAFTMADCAAAPALYYADRVVPLAAYPNVARYRERLLARPSYARVLREAAPYLHLVPT